ncbi:MAG TPA: decaprenyl-phosphate phosphoribosyltransferase, partial [bacterium]|nr:decaprenyl-phosphate phosphoribosyltransferase [bacterium]
MGALVTLMRPRQWIKNVVVFAGLVFAGRLSDPTFVQPSLMAFAVFCVASSGIYVFNDLLDVENDRLHPEKRTRPIASGQVGKLAALGLALLLWAIAGLVAFRLGPRFGGTILAFLSLNVLYSAWLKRGVIIDVMSISVSFMLRAIGGVEILRDLDPSVALSRWLLLCTFFLALVMSFGKRRSELVLLDSSASSHRAALGQYSVALLDVIIPLVSACAILAYSIYTIWPETVARLGTDKLVYTVPIVVYGFFRYL